MRALAIVPVLSALCILASPACAPRSAVTTWPYSHWYRQGGGEMGGFEDQRRTCLEQAGAAGDPTAVKPDSPEETRYLICMNGAGWCTSTFNCDKPGAS